MLQGKGSVALSKAADLAKERLAFFNRVMGYDKPEQPVVEVTKKRKQTKAGKSK